VILYIVEHMTHTQSNRRHIHSHSGTGDVSLIAISDVGFGMSDVGLK
jgi:hypothetical protein